MDKLIELLQQIQELAGVGVDALKGAGGQHGQPHGGPPHEGGQPPHGGPPHEGGAPRPGGAPGGTSPMDAEDRKDGGKDEAAEGEAPLKRY